MAIQINKPYVWLDKSNPAPVINFKVWCADGLGIDNVTGYAGESQQEDVLIVAYKIQRRSVTPSVLTHQLDSRHGSIYNSAIHNKVTLIILNEDDTLAGFTSIMPIDQFDTGTTPPYWPYAYLKFIATDNMKIYMVADLPSKCTVAMLPHNDFENTRFVKFKISGGVASDIIATEIEYPLDATTNFDPVIEKVEVILLEDDAAGIERRKGTGTVHTSEGDASGDD